MTVSLDVAHERALEEYLATGTIPAELAEQRALSTGTNSAGGWTVPQRFYDKLHERIKAYGGIAAAAEEITTSDARFLPIPTIDDTANIGELVAEGGTLSTGTDFTFGQRLMTGFKYMAGGAGNLPLKVSWELDQDSDYPLQDYIARKLGERIARAQAAHFATGSGIQQPQGLVQPITTVGAIANNTTGPTYAELLATTTALDPAYRKNASWVMNSGTLTKIGALADSSGEPLFPNLAADSAGRRSILGYPVIIDQGMPSIASGAKFLAFGDIEKAYLIRRVKATTIVVLREIYAPQAQVGYMAWARADGMVQDPYAVVVRTGA